MSSSIFPTDFLILIVFEVPDLPRADAILAEKQSLEVHTFQTAVRDRDEEGDKNVPFPSDGVFLSRLSHSQRRSKTVNCFVAFSFLCPALPFGHNPRAILTDLSDTEIVVIL